MPYPKNKEERYSNLGGINRKVSQYLNGPMEFLDLQNTSSKVIGALQSACGSSQILSNTTTGPITGVFRTPPGPISIASYGNILVGTDNSFLGPTMAVQTPLGVTRSQWYPGFSAAYYQFQSANNITYACNGSEFFACGASNSPTALLFSLPTPVKLSGFAAGTASGSFVIGHTLVVSFAFIRSDGFIGPKVDWAPVYFGNTVSMFRFLAPTIANFNAGGGGFSNGSWGISGLLAWFSYDGSTPKGTSAIYTPGATFSIHDTCLAGGSYVVDDPQPKSGYGSFWDDYSGNSSNAAIYNQPGPNPRTIALFNNQLFMAGMVVTARDGSGNGLTDSPQDTVWYSDIGDLEFRSPENFFQVRKGDGDRISCLKSYFTQLIIFKVNAISALSGTDPDNFVLSEVSDQFGCVSNNGACVWDQKLWFIDARGVCEYNGSNTNIVSQKVQYIFDRLNVDAAKITAQAIHVKERNELWFALPIDGSSTNNVIVVYDYVAEAWSTRFISSALPIGAIEQRQQVQDKSLPYFGGQSGIVYQFGASLFTDAGNAFTSVIKSSFLSNMGHSTEKMFRRLYLDASIPAGSTYTIGVNLYRNQGATAYLRTTMVISDFQKRMDFGVSGKDLAVEFVYSGGGFLQINGFTIEYRFQRAV